MGVPLPGGLSPSSFGAFKDCPLAFRFSYLERLPQPPSPAACKGTLVHRALERLMLRPPERRTLTAALEDLDAARADLADDPELQALELGDKERQAFEAGAASLVERYFELEDPRSVRPIGLELGLSVEIGSVKLRGVIDRLELDEHGELVITDYKTGSVPREQHEQRRLTAVHLYALMVERTLGRRPVRVQLLYLSKPEAIIARPSEQSVQGAARKAGALWSAIVQACVRADFRPRPSALCDWCAYRPYCPAWGGNPDLAAELRGPGTVIAPPLPIEALPVQV